MVDLQSLIWLTLTALIFGFLWRTYQLKERALIAVKRRCSVLGLQFLDQSVALKKARLKRSKAGLLRLWRCYAFEFSSTGDERYQGEVVLLGTEIESITLQAHRLPGEGEPSTFQ